MRTLYFVLFLLLSFFFPRLISAVADWMSSIHGVALGELTMHVWNLLHAARLRYRMHKVAKNYPSGHHCTTLSDYIFAINARIDNRKKTRTKQQYLPHMSLQYGELRPTSGWDLLVILGHPSKFQRVPRLGSVTARLLGVSQILRRWTEGATYIRQGGHHVGHWSTF